jgi:hypothetical protein
MSDVLGISLHQNWYLNMDLFSPYRILENSLREKGKLSINVNKNLSHIQLEYPQYHTKQAYFTGFSIVLITHSSQI